MNSKPLISIVIPVYNVEDTIDKCIMSVIRQTYNELQIILVDDGSTDTSGTKCDQWQSFDSRIEVIHTANAGLSMARNTGMKLVDGDFVVFIDSDDQIGPKHIENLFNAASNNKSADVIVVTGFTTVKYKSDIQFTNSNDIKNEVLLPATAISISVTIGERFAAHAWGKLYPRKCFSILYYPPNRYFEDQFVTYKAFLAVKNIIYEDANDYFYTINRSDSISRGPRIRELDYLDAIRETFNVVCEKCPKAVPAVKTRYLNTLINCLKIAAVEGTDEQFKKLYRETKTVRKTVFSNKKLQCETKMKYLFTFLGSEVIQTLYKFFK